MNKKKSEIDIWLDRAIDLEKMKRRLGYKTSAHFDQFKTHLLYIEVTDKGLGRIVSDISDKIKR